MKPKILIIDRFATRHAKVDIYLHKIVDNVEYKIAETVPEIKALKEIDIHQFDAIIICSVSLIDDYLPTTFFFVELFRKAGFTKPILAKRGYKQWVDMMEEAGVSHFYQNDYKVSALLQELLNIEI